MIQCRQLEDCESDKYNTTPEGRGKDSEHDGETHGMADQRNRCVRQARRAFPRLQARMHLGEESTAMEVAKPRSDVNGQQNDECVQCKWRWYRMAEQTMCKVTNVHIA